MEVDPMSASAPQIRREFAPSAGGAKETWRREERI